ncbi:MAG: winged helix-turn-helix transcriptional regulator [Sedimentisphaerales bacterium]|nr:winged helix-turn-helix transcriptional regulator [Sedimentisphaerales bacterium]
MADAVKLAEIFKIFSVEPRVRIVLALKKRGMCVTELESQLGISQEATSQHLRVLKEKRIVTFQKRGFHVYYSIDKQNLDLIRKMVEAFFEL